MISPLFRNRLLIAGAALTAVALFWFAGRIFALPAPNSYGATLLRQPSPVAAIVVAGVVFAGAVAIGTVIARPAGPLAGLFAGAVGMIALSLRGGTINDVLLGATGRNIFVLLTLEMLTLAGCLLLADLALNAMETDDLASDVAGPDASWLTNVQSLALHMLTTGLIVGLIAQTGQKPQVLIAVFAGSFLASLLAESLFPVSRGTWLWLSPPLLGCIGYLLAWRWADSWTIGLVGGHLGAPLARPLPLDWAGAGPAGAIAGYWLCARWMREQETAERAAAFAAENPHVPTSSPPPESDETPSP